MHRPQIELARGRRIARHTVQQNQLGATAAPQGFDGKPDLVDGAGAGRKDRADLEAADVFEERDIGHLARRDLDRVDLQIADQEIETVEIERGAQERHLPVGAIFLHLLQGRPVELERLAHFKLVCRVGHGFLLVRRLGGEAADLLFRLERLELDDLHPGLDRNVDQRAAPAPDRRCG